MDKEEKDEIMSLLDQEIESAVDHRFFERKKDFSEDLSLEPTLSESHYSTDKNMDMNNISSPLPPIFGEKKDLSKELITEPTLSESHYNPDKKMDLDSIPVPLSQIFASSEMLDKIEIQLLSLEWEISLENLIKTKEAILVFREHMKEQKDILSILDFMVEVINHVMKDEENIQPPMMKFLLDSKETIKYLLKKEKDTEFNVYKQLVCEGIRARYSLLKVSKEIRMDHPQMNLEKEVSYISASKNEKVDDMLKKIENISHKIDGFLFQMGSHLESIRQKTIYHPISSTEVKTLPVSIIVFKVEGKILGVISENVNQLFKVSNEIYDKCLNRSKIRLRGIEVKMIDLGEILLIKKERRKGEIKILVVKDNGEYKGLLVDQILTKINQPVDTLKAGNPYFLGVVHWLYQDHPVDIPVLDLKKI